LFREKLSLRTLRLRGVNDKGTVPDVGWLPVPGHLCCR